MPTEKNNTRLIYGNCLDVMNELCDCSIDMVLCDLPYGTTACKWDVVIPFAPLWDCYRRLVKPNGAILLFGTEPFSSYLRLSNIEMFRYDWYWEKDKGANWMFGNKMPLKTFEVVSVFYEKQPVYNPQKVINPKGVSTRHLHKNPSKITDNVRDVMGDSWKETEMVDGENYHGKNYEPDKLLPRQSIYFAREQRGKVHPTQKPVALLEYLIRTYTNTGDVVLDNSMGSGSTGVACVNTERNFVGIEINKHYFDLANRRINESLNDQSQQQLP